MIEVHVEDRLVDLGEGFRDGLAEMLIKVLEACRLEVSDEARARIRCRDRATDDLEGWMARMMDVASAEELFEASAD